MKYKKDMLNKKKFRLMIEVFILSLTIFGIWYSSINFIKYTRGFLAYKEIKEYDSNEELLGNTFMNPNLSFVDSENQAGEEQVLYPIRPANGEEIGELYIPKLNAILPIYHGTSEEELEKGVGHFTGSALPGEKDNSVLSGHRDTVFRKLGEVSEGDTLIVRTSAGEFEYKVNKVRIVDKEDRTVIVPKPKATLTVSTCYPFEYIGSAPKRYILVAYLASKTVY